jgi:GT2 family glycosyltransferase
LLGVDRMQIAVIIATTGRPTEVAELIECLNQQTEPPKIVVLSVVEDADLPAPLPAHIMVVRGPKGSVVQRNSGMLAVMDSCELIVFLDDDYIPSKRMMAGVSKLFFENPDVSGATGLVLEDGVTSGGISSSRARELVEHFDRSTDEKPSELVDIMTAYGCNMAFRTAAIRDIRFDENLPLYGWLEDVDFAGQLSRRGRMVRSNHFAGVHRGVSAARSSGVRFGYSQVVNPVYLIRKGTMQRRHAIWLMSRNLIANHKGVFFPKNDIDRLGRVRGNWLGIFDLLRGRADTRRILKL